VRAKRDQYAHPDASMPTRLPQQSGIALRRGDIMCRKFVEGSPLYRQEQSWRAWALNSPPDDGQLDARWRGLAAADLRQYIRMAGQESVPERQRNHVMRMLRVSRKPQLTNALSGRKR